MFFCREPGRVFTVLGPNGAGEATATRMVPTLMCPSSGRISAVGTDAARHPREVRPRTGCLSSTSRLCDRPSPDELVAHCAAPQEVDRVQWKAPRSFPTFWALRSHYQAGHMTDIHKLSAVAFKANLRVLVRVATEQ
ncbi:MAG: hypothetical protein H5U38_09745 [Calditrichaeota bacterium]|nr:hypothetical protein [Calditrichota bacterium]